MTDETALAGGDNRAQQGETPPDDLSLDTDTVFGALAHERRRRALAHLRARMEHVAIRELAAHIANAECTNGMAPMKQRKEVTTSLYHVHLPKLVETDLVTWQDDQKRDAVKVTNKGNSLPTELSWLPSNMSAAIE